MHPALERIREIIQGTPFEGDVWVVGGAVRDEILGLPHKNDFDLVTQGSSAELGQLLWRAGASNIEPVTYERFGTALVKVMGCDIEIVTARRESYEENSRKPSVEAASYLEDAQRRDFTLNTLRRNLSSGELSDILGTGLTDIKLRVLRTPLDPEATFRDDPLRMLRAVRFRWRFDLSPAGGVYDAIRNNAYRLSIISRERIRDEWVKMLSHPSAPEAMNDLLDLGLLGEFIPEFLPMVGCEQGKYHHLDVWDHTLLVLKNAGCDHLELSLAALFHDVGKPETRSVDEQGNTRFFTHEYVGQQLSIKILRRMKFPEKLVEQVSRLVKNHMRLGSAPSFSANAARRLLRDLQDDTELLLQLVDADSRGLKAGVQVMDIDAIRERLRSVQQETPVQKLESPLSGDEIIALTGMAPGRMIGKVKLMLCDKVLDGELHPDDKPAAEAFVTEFTSKLTRDDDPRN